MALDRCLKFRGLFVGLCVLATCPGCRKAPEAALSRQDWEYAQQQLFLGTEAQRREFLDSQKGRKLCELRLMNIFSPDGLEILRASKTCKPLFVVDRTWNDGSAAVKKGGGSHEVIGDYSIVARGPELRPHDVSQLQAALLDGKQYFVSFDCLPSPPVAFEFCSRKGTLSVCVDYECGYIHVYFSSSSGTVLHRRSAYYQDPLGNPDTLGRIARQLVEPK